MIINSSSQKDVNILDKPITIGLPRAMLYYRYKTLWHSFFEELGFSVIESAPTSKLTLEEGAALAIDEACLSLKIFLGHVKALIGKCDYILIPRISNFGINHEMCCRFEALYDLTRNVFRESGQKFLTYNADMIQKKSEWAAFMGLGQFFGFTVKAANKAYRTAKKAEQRQQKAEQKKQELLYRSEKIKILIAAHSYVICDAYIGKPVIEFLKGSDVVPIRADVIDPEDGAKAGKELSPTCKWQINREILGSIVQNRDKTDGIILLSAFPCGPDSMVNEIIARRVKDLPILNLVMDGQNGTAGVETRLESFIDIIRFKEGKL